MQLPLVQSHRSACSWAFVWCNCSIRQRITVLRAPMHLLLLSTATSSCSLCSTSATLCSRLARSNQPPHCVLCIRCAPRFRDSWATLSFCLCAFVIVRALLSSRVERSTHNGTFVCFTFVAMDCIAANKTCRRCCRATVSATAAKPRHDRPPLL